MLQSLLLAVPGVCVCVFSQKDIAVKPYFMVWLLFPLP